MNWASRRHQTDTNLLQQLFGDTLVRDVVRGYVAGYCAGSSIGKSFDNLSGSF